MEWWRIKRRELVFFPLCLSFSSSSWELTRFESSVFDGFNILWIINICLNLVCFFYFVIFLLSLQCDVLMSHFFWCLRRLVKRKLTTASVEIGRSVCGNVFL